MQNDLDEMINECKSSEERAKKAMVDAARLADELRAHAEVAANAEKSKKSMEAQMKEMQARLDEAEKDSIKGGKKYITKLEGKCKDLEHELENEIRKGAEHARSSKKAERKIKELQFQAEEEKKNFDRMHELVDQLQNKLATYRKQLEDSEEIASMNLTKFKKAQQELEDADDKVRAAEQQVQKLRAKIRSGTPV